MSVLRFFVVWYVPVTYSEGSHYTRIIQVSRVEERRKRKTKIRGVRVVGILRSGVVGIFPTVVSWASSRLVVAQLVVARCGNAV